MTDKILTRLYALIIACCYIIPLAAQNSDLLQVTGKTTNYYGKPGEPNVLNNEELDITTVNQLKKPLLAITNMIEQSPGFNPPKGFDLHVQLSIYKSSPYSYPVQHMVVGFTWLAMHEFYKEDGKIAVNPETGAGMLVYINELLKLFPDDSNNACDESELPRFFIKTHWNIKDSSASYLQLTDGTRIVSNGKPLAIPYTREQFIKYLVKKDEKILKDLQEGQAGFIAMKKSSAVAPDGHKVTAADRNNEKYNYLLVILENVDTTITAFTQKIAAQQKKLRDRNTLLANMSATEKKQPAYMVFNTDTDRSVDPGRFFEPATPGDPDAVALLTPNPDYFNTALPKTSVQLITVKEDLAERFESSWFIQLVHKVRDDIDYKALKKMIQ